MIRILRTSSLGDILGIGAVLVIAIFSLVLLIAPSIIVLIISFDTRAFISFPPEGFTLRWYAEVTNSATTARTPMSSASTGCCEKTRQIVFPTTPSPSAPRKSP